LRAYDLGASNDGLSSDDRLSGSNWLSWSDGVFGDIFFSLSVFVLSDFSSETFSRGLILGLLSYIFCHRLIFGGCVGFFLWNIFNYSVSFFIGLEFSDLLNDCGWNIINLGFNSVIISPYFLDWNLDFFCNSFVFNFYSVLSVIFNSSFSLWNISSFSWNNLSDCI
jgi:hypothetical protein